MSNSSEITTPEGTGNSLLRLVPIILGCLLAPFLINELQNTGTRLDEAALGRTTMPVFADRNGMRIHVDDLSRLSEIAEASDSTPHRRSVLWLGNSQIHAINQFKSGQKNVVSYAHESLMAGDAAFLSCVSFPNANLQEHFLALEGYCSVVDTPEILLIPVVFDDLRESGLRFSIKDWATSQADNVRYFGESQFQELLLDTDSQDNTNDVVSRTLQDRTEAVLDRFLSSRSTLWNDRANLRGQVFLRLHHLRNRIFQIDSQSVRKKIPERYRQNMTALDEILNFCSSRSITPIVYVPPLRNDVKRPFVASEYESFLSDLRDAVREHPRVHFADFESIVPGKFWGSTGATDGSDRVEYDFMHFQEEGHKILAEAACLVVKSVLKEKSQ